MKGKCKANGYTKDVSGSSIDRFTKFLGLTAFQQPSSASDLFDIQTAGLRSTLRTNGLCPAIKAAATGALERASAVVANVSEHISGCATMVKAVCAARITKFASPLIAYMVLAYVERAFGVGWARMVIQLGDHGMKLQSDLEVVPAAVKDFMQKLFPLIKGTHTLASKVLEVWNGVKDYIHAALPTFVSLVVRPLFDLLLTQYSQEDFQALQSRAMELKIDKQVEVAIGQVNGLCLSTSEKAMV